MTSNNVTSNTGESILYKVTKPAFCATCQGIGVGAAYITQIPNGLVIKAFVEIAKFSAQRAVGGAGLQALLLEASILGHGMPWALALGTAANPIVGAALGFTVYWCTKKAATVAYDLLCSQKSDGMESQLEDLAKKA